MAHEYLTELTPRRPRIWVRAVERLHALLQFHGTATRAAFARGLQARVFGAEYIAHYLAPTDRDVPTATPDLFV